jgi:ribulose-phosphate 3-epimerase
MVLVMTVHPGFGAQKYIAEAARKVIRVREIVGPDIRVEVDGGIDPQTAPTVVSYGADTIVAGNAIFSRPDRKAAINAIREACGYLLGLFSGLSHKFLSVTVMNFGKILWL